MPLPASLSLDELKRLIDVQLGADDEILEFYLEAAFEQAQAPPPYGCGRLLTPDPATDAMPPVVRRVTTRGRLVDIPDAREITEVRVDGAVVDAAAYDAIAQDGYVVELNLGAVGWGFPAWNGARRTRTVDVTGRFGFATIPANLRDAIYILAARSFYERNAQYADQVAVAEGGSAQVYYRQLPPRTKLVFASYSVFVGAV